MTRVPVLLVLACLLAGCGRPQSTSVETLATDPARLKVLRLQCRSAERDEALCARVAQADVRRFLSGHSGADEYQTLIELPPIPASFDEPITLEEDAP